MLVIPAIDLKQGQCVRLRQGRMQESTNYSDNPVAMAEHWWEQGARRLHMVDLDGAFAGERINASAIEQVVKTLPDMQVQAGGGIRNADTIARYLDAGVAYVILGTQAAQQPERVGEYCQRWPGQVIAGIDARDGVVATQGWAESGQMQAHELAQKLVAAGVKRIIYTNIARDGMLEGADLEGSIALATASGARVIVSGGVRDLDDIRALLACGEAQLEGVIVGKSIYEGNLDLAAAIKLCEAG